jgi:hypothetical protein
MKTGKTHFFSLNDKYIYKHPILIEEGKAEKQAIWCRCVKA